MTDKLIFQGVEIIPDSPVDEETVWIIPGFTREELEAAGIEVIEMISLVASDKGE